MKPVRIVSDYPVPPAELWAVATDYGALAEVMRGLVTFDGLPEGRTYTAQSFGVNVSLFGRLPWQPYHMTVLECDEARMILRSSEKGAGVRQWLHTLSVTETDAGSRLTDHIEIDAGLMTPVFRAWARYLYSARHAPRLKILGAGPV